MSLFMDQALARRLERVEASVGASCAEVRRKLMPEVGASWQDFAGTYAIFDGAESPMTQTFGLGVFAPTTIDMLAALEAFFAQRGAPPVHEVSSLAGMETHALLAERGYRPIELSTVLVQELDDRIAAAVESSPLRARLCEPADRAAWVEASVEGWSTDADTAAVIRTFAELVSHNPTMAHFQVDQAGTVIATGSLGLHDGIALLAGASTIPRARGLGAQAVLFGARLAEARRRGCTLAMMATSPGSTSQRNAERRGFRVAYTRTKWLRAASAAADETGSTRPP